MSRAKGYSSYRGRTPRGRIVLAVVLVLVILVALGCIVLQTLVVYDSSGNPRLQLPDLFGGEQVEEDLPQEDLDLTIEVPEIVLDAIAGYLAPEEPLTVEGLGSIEAALEQAGQGQRKYDAVAVPLKTSGGTVLFDSETALTGTVEMEPDTMQALGTLTGDETYTIAVISCFHDPKAANSDVEGMGLKNTGGYIFYDGDNSQWLDPGKEAARAYVCGLIQEAAELGFDEILLTDVSYPLAGKLDRVDYGDGEPRENLMGFLDQARQALEGFEDVKLSVELTEDFQEGAVVLELSQVLGNLDRVYVSGTAYETALETALAADVPETAVVAVGGEVPEEAKSYLIAPQ